MIFRLTAPNWERPSPYYGSHIIMSISGIYLLISIHTLYHSLVLSLSLVHEITYFHHTLRLLKYTSAAFSSLAPTDDSRRTLSIYTMSFYRRRYAGGQLSVASLPTGICILISWALDRLHPASANWDITDVPYIFRRRNIPDLSAQVQPSLLNIDLHSTIREQQVQTSNIISTDKYNPVRATHQYM